MVLALLLALLLSAPPPAPADAEARPCANPYRQADEGRPEAVVRRLDQLPPGRLELAVLRSVAGCPEPVVLREGIGASPAPLPPPVRR